jgi:hypothetical protein
LAQAAIPGSEIEIFDESGHFPHHTDPVRFVQIVSDFLHQSTPARFDPEEWRDRLRRGKRINTSETVTADLEMMALPLSPLPSAN